MSDGLVLAVIFMTPLSATMVAFYLIRVIQGTKSDKPADWRLGYNPANAVFFGSLLTESGLRARRRLLVWLVVLLLPIGLVIVFEF